MTACGVRVEIVSSAARLAALEPAWWELFSRAPRATPFQAPAWLIPWVDTFANDGRRLRAIAVLSERALLGLLPLVLTDERCGRVARLAGSGVSDYLDALIDPGARGPVLGAFSEALAGLAEEVSSVELSDVPGDSLLPELDARARRRGSAPCSLCPRVSLSRDYESYVESLPAWLRRNLRQGASRLAREGADHRVADVPGVGALLEAFFEVHRARWAPRGEPGALDDASVRAFHRRAAPRLVARGLLELSGLFVRERLVAASYVLTRTDASLYLTGFDPAFQRASAGSLVIARAILRAFAAGRRYFDFLRGAEPYKYAWGARDSGTLQLSFEGDARARSAAAECRA